MDKKLEQKKLDLLKLKNVVAVGEGLDGVLEVSVVHKITENKLDAKDIIPKKVLDRKTNVTATGEFHALSYTQRQRPAPGGISIGHPSITAGTLGTWFKGVDGKWYILSNNHVLADMNDAEIGDLIIQPGTADEGKLPEDAIAKLVNFVPIKWRTPDDDDDDDDNGPCPFASAYRIVGNALARMLFSSKRVKIVTLADDEENLVDCAIAEALSPDDVDSNILDIGKCKGVNYEPHVRLEVQKTGRTTQHTQGLISQVNVTSVVRYGGKGTANFRDQLMVTSNDARFSAGGDSGSLVLDMENHAVGLLFAGSTTQTLINKIKNVEEALQITIPGSANVNHKASFIPSFIS